MTVEEAKKIAHGLIQGYINQADLVTALNITTILRPIALGLPPTAATVEAATK
jgi:hypothetical protein